MTINCNGKLIDLSSPKVMGILNFTPDSFFDGGKYKTDVEILSHTEKMLSEGADFIDVGTYSSRPNATFVSEEEEINRMKSVMKVLSREFPNAIYSIDTFRSEVAKVALDNGGAIINDISAGNLDPEMMDVVAQHQASYIMMHTRGTPQTKQTLTNYDNLIHEILFYFSKKIAEARSKGINDLIIDVGFGFAKTIEQNFELMSKLELFRELGLPNLVGISRKTMIYKTLNINQKESLSGTITLNTIALLKGANILRVHDVKEARQSIKLIKQIKN